MLIIGMLIVNYTKYVPYTKVLTLLLLVNTSTLNSSYITASKNIYNFTKDFYIK